MLKILILCTGNSCRSILAEALLNHLGQGRVQAFSAGSKPAGEVHPKSLALLQSKGISTEGLRSKSWDEFGDVAFDAVITVCDNAAGESCPIWPGHPTKAHWGIEDPAAVEGPEFKKRQAFEDALRFMRNRITAFINLPIASIDRMAMSAHLKSIGAMDGSTGKASGAA